MDEMVLLDLLSKDPRATVTDLADILGETEETVENAMNSLTEKKIICGYHTVINWDKTNIDHVDAMIGVSAKPERDTGYDKIAERIAKFPEVSALYLMSGTWEFIVNVNGKTMREIAEFVGSKLAPVDGVTATTTMFVLRKYKVNSVIMDGKQDIVDDRMPISA